MTSYTDGDAKWSFAPISVTPGDTYNFSDWYQSNVVTQVVVYFTNTDGSEYYLGLRTAPASSNWAQYSESFQIPYKAKTMTVYHLLASTGSLTTDDYSLVKSTPKGFSKPIVSLTFDNCWEDNVNTVLPVMKTYGYKGTFFISTNYTIMSPATGPINVSGPMAVKAIASNGFEIASHSVYHEIDLAYDNPSDVAWELTQSKTYLEGLVGANTVTDFATPFGSYNDDVVNAIKQVYLSHRTTDEGYNTQENYDPYRLIVQNLQKDTTLAEYRSWINQTAKDKSWLILVYHCVAPGSTSSLSQWDTPQKDFQPQMNAIKNSGITVETVAQALSETSQQVSK